MNKRIRLIVNPIAGKRQEFDFVGALRKELDRTDRDLKVFETRQKGDAKALAASEECRDCLVIAAGGDGTISEVAQGIDLETARLGILPLGTANDMALELGISTNLRTAVKRTVRGEETRWDVGVANGRRFVVFSGTAFDAAVTGTVHEERKSNITYLSYVVPALKTYAAWKSPRIRVSLDGKPLDGYSSQVLISNVKRLAPCFQLSHTIAPDDGVLHVLVFRREGRLALLEYTTALFFRLPQWMNTLENYKAQEILLESEDENVPYQLDGDPVGTLPLKISVLPRALRIVV
jgi:YegS/Rv2252/BmrU family lipid kinase